MIYRIFILVKPFQWALMPCGWGHCHAGIRIDAFHNGHDSMNEQRAAFWSKTRIWYQCRISSGRWTHMKKTWCTGIKIQMYKCFQLQLGISLMNHGAWQDGKSRLVCQYNMWAQVLGRSYRAPVQGGASHSWFEFICSHSSCFSEALCWLIAARQS